MSTLEIARIADPGTTMQLDGNSLTINDFPLITAGEPIAISPSVKERIDSSYAFVQNRAKDHGPHYGINTGFGFLAREEIPHEELLALQKNILVSHAAGFGPLLSKSEIRLSMVLRLNTLLRGHSGVSFDLCQSLRDLINANILPVIHNYGSVGASGDLVPLAHLALPLIGVGMVTFQGETLTAKEALNRAGLKPYTLNIKEGLALINGTQVMLAIGSLALIEAKQLYNHANLIASLTYEGLGAHIAPLDPLIHKVRGHHGQILTAQSMRKALEGSYLYRPDTRRTRIQDPYSLRCTPQVHGPAIDGVENALRTISEELNSSTDNPLVFAEEKKILSGGNFHGQYLATAFDSAAIAFAELGSISERRLDLLLSPHMSNLPAFLTPTPGTCSGYMATQYLSASLVNENKLLANPCSTDSIPGNVGIEDHVSMGMNSARKLRQLVDNVRTILSIEMLAAAQAVHLSEVGPLGKETNELYKRIRQLIPPLKEDRILSKEIEDAVNLLKGLSQGVCQPSQLPRP